MKKNELSQKARMEFSGAVKANQEVCGDFFRMKLAVPDTFRKAVPGQFVHIRVARGTDPLIRRPFSLTRVFREGQHWFIELLYRRLGRATELLSQARPGDELSVEGPLGNGFRVDPRRSVIVLVAGGYGIAPLYFLAERLRASRRRPEVHVLIGARKKEHLLCVEELKKLGVTVHLATDDGSAGFRGKITDYFAGLASQRRLSRTRTAVYACGPQAMMKALDVECRKARIPCQVSLEELMACGVGVCLTCVCRVRIPRRGRSAGAGWKYQRVCSDGPIFDAASVIF